jgi:membrane associated rhomboid family serine protease
MTPWVMRLLIANVAMHFVVWDLQGMPRFPSVIQALWLVPAQMLVRPWTMVTYMFLHGGLWHLLFNMIMLFFFGPRLEVRLGSRHFLGLYFFSGIVAAVASLLTPWVAVVGASGALFGILLAFARYWPTERIFVFGVLPIQARLFVIILTVMSLWAGIGGAIGGIAHFAHLGGFVGGWVYLVVLERRSPAG